MSAGEGSMANATFAKGLEGVVAGESGISLIDGEKGRLSYRGYSIEDLAAHSSYEEVVYLLLYGKLPTRYVFDEFSLRMRASRPLHPKVIRMIRDFPEGGKPMELLQSVMAYLSGYVEHRIEHSSTCNCRQTLHQVAQLATVAATYHRFKQGLDYLAPRADLSHGANFLYMLRGREPDADEGRIMDASFVLHAEHGFNASTFTARVVASTLSTCYCSIAAAIGALYGSLHGGANEKVFDMLESIGSVDKVEAWVGKAFEEAQKIMGMGHRIYKTKDPRSKIMEGFLEKLSEKTGRHEHLDMLRRIEELATPKFESKDKKIYPNVDYYSGSVYHLLGIPKYLFVPIFAIARIPGWLAHILEQREENRIFRPDSVYVGPEERAYAPIEERG
jgi:citrate synthase